MKPDQRYELDRIRRARLGAAAAACISALAPLLGVAACSNGVDTDPIDTTEVRHDSIAVIARDLDVPWDLAFLPGGDLLVTERPGRLVRLSPSGERRWAVPVEGVRASGEGGQLGLALHPSFEENRWIYVYFTAEAENRIERYRLGEDGALLDRAVILDGIPAAPVHDGGRIAFGPDGLLYATTGDAGGGGRAQDPTSLGGKILRMTDEGDPAPGNPLGGYVYTMGHRNVQGIAWADDGTMWATEHGARARDELNRIEAGANYGWPEVQGDETAEGFRSPVAHSGSEETWAPAGMAWTDGRIFFVGLRGRSLYEAVPQGGGASVTPHLHDRFGRLRDVKVGPDGMLWVLTNNTDGRGDPRAGDDKLVRIDPGSLGG